MWTHGDGSHVEQLCISQVNRDIARTLAPHSSTHFIQTFENCLKQRGDVITAMCLMKWPIDHSCRHSPTRSQERCRAHSQVVAERVEGCGDICWGLCRLCSHQSPHEWGMTGSRTCCLNAAKDSVQNLSKACSTVQQLVTISQQSFLVSSK